MPTRAQLRRRIRRMQAAADRGPFHFDRQITIQRPQVQRDPFGGPGRKVWVDVVTLWAQVNQSGVDARYITQANRELAQRSAEFVFPWRSGIDETMRILYDGLAWDIRGIGEIGFRRLTRLYGRTDVDMPAPTS